MEESYRMVSKQYHCYVCEKKLKKMVSVADLHKKSFFCDICNQDFVEIIEPQQQQNFEPPEEQIQQEGGQSMIRQLQANSQIEADNSFAPPKVTRTVEDLTNTNLNCDQYGRPLDRLDLRNTSTRTDNAGRPIQQQQQNDRVQQEEIKQNQPNNRQNNAHYNQNQQQQFLNANNAPGLHGVDINNINDAINLGINLGNQVNSMNHQRHPNFNRQQNVFRNNGRQQFNNNINFSHNQNGGFEDFDRIFGPQFQQQFEGPPFDQSFSQSFNFGSMFQDDPFVSMRNSSFFNAPEFGQNYQQNFRSSTGFSNQGHGQSMNFMDLAEIIQQRMAEAQSMEEENEQRRPTDQNFVRSLPEQSISEKHCKKGEDGSLEKPTCNVCITDFELGDKALFIPCGHIFHPDCIKPWLKDHNTCPVCRKELPTQ